MGDLRPVYGRKFVGYGRLRHRARPYTVVYDRRNDRPGESSVGLWEKVQSKHNFWQLPNVL